MVNIESWERSLSDPEKGFGVRFRSDKSGFEGDDVNLIISAVNGILKRKEVFLGRTGADGIEVLFYSYFKVVLVKREWLEGVCQSGEKGSLKA